MLDWRLKAFRHWLTMETPDWAKLNVPPIDYQDAYYYAAPKPPSSRAASRATWKLQAASPQMGHSPRPLLTLRSLREPL